MKINVEWERTMGQLERGEIKASEARRQLLKIESNQVFVEEAMLWRWAVATSWWTTRKAASAISLEASSIP